MSVAFRFSKIQLVTFAYCNQQTDIKVSVNEIQTHKSRSRCFDSICT